MEDLRKENKAIVLATIELSPKSLTPNTDNTTLEVYKLTPIENSILTYRKIVFFAMRLLLSDIDGICYSKVVWQTNLFSKIIQCQIQVTTQLPHPCAIIFSATNGD
jgi:hypothetical protein